LIKNNFAVKKEAVYNTVQEIAAGLGKSEAISPNLFFKLKENVSENSKF
jgi:hypothetical protein